MAFFCRKTGVRIDGPGVSKAVDPENGRNEIKPDVPSASPEAPEESKSEPKPKKRVGSLI